jgi:hypothetical protein
VTVEAFTTVQVPTFATQVLGKAKSDPGSEAVADTVCEVAALLVKVNDTVTRLPGPVQASGTLTVGCPTLLTVTVKLQVAVPAALSAAVQVTVVVPIGKVDPEGGTQVTTAPSQLGVVGS